MTGQAVGRFADENGVLVLEARSVNGKHFNLSLRLPNELAFLESRLGALCQQRVSRGSLRVCVIEFSGFHATDRPPVFDERLARSYLELIAGLPEGVGKGITAPELLRLPGVLRADEPPLDTAGLERALDHCATEALDGLLEARRAEGERLGKALRGILVEFGRLSLELRRAAAELPERQRQALRDRLVELTEGLAQGLDEGRLEQEVAYLAQRADITEELDRLDSHLEAFGQALDGGGEIGRRLEFLCQEIHRELNTCGSKTQGMESGPIILELKLLQDRLREQVANLA